MFINFVDLTQTTFKERTETMFMFTQISYYFKNLNIPNSISFKFPEAIS